LTIHYRLCFLNCQDQGGEDVNDISTKEPCSSKLDSATEENNIHTEIPDLDQVKCASQEAILDQDLTLKRSSNEYPTKQGNSLLNRKCSFEIMHITPIYDR